MPQPLTLYNNTFWTSPYAFAVFVALREKGIPFETRDVALHEGAQRAGGDYAKKTLTARVPALDHDGFVVAESMAILEYLEEAFPGTPSVFPKDPKERARARQMLSWIRSDDTLPIREERSAEKIYYPEQRKANAPLSDAAKKSAAKLFALAEGLLAPGATQLFGSWCIADADLAFFTQRLLSNGDAVPSGLAALATAQWKRPSVAAWNDHARPAFVPY
jgi:glutathione S-transferase